MRGRRLRLDVVRGHLLTECYPLGVFTTGGGSDRPRICARVQGHVLDLGTAAARHGSALEPLLSAPHLNPFLAAGPVVWRKLREVLPDWVADRDQLIPAADVT